MAGVASYLRRSGRFESRHFRQALDDSIDQGLQIPCRATTPPQTCGSAIAWRKGPRPRACAGVAQCNLNAPRRPTLKVKSLVSGPARIGRGRGTQD
jgi:hypothetical protein